MCALRRKLGTNAAARQWKLQTHRTPFVFHLMEIQLEGLITLYLLILCVRGVAAQEALIAQVVKKQVWLKKKSSSNKWLVHIRKKHISSVWGKKN